MSRNIRRALCALMAICYVQHAIAQATTQPSFEEPSQGASLDELLNTKVTLVSRTPEPVSETASAIQVITNEDITRSAALSLPEALRLAPNLLVAQVNASQWGISARGFDGGAVQQGSFSNKLLVMIDGRAVYSPLFGGVFWDVQNVLLEDVDRIEIVSGPGGTLWGANAVNGVINVVTKSARDTQGLYFTQAAGNVWESYTGVRYGGKIDDDLYYRVYGLGFLHSNTFLPDGKSADDDWNLQQGGFRVDYYPTSENTLTFQGDTYTGNENDPGTTDVAGGNLLGRFTHVFSKDSDLIVQTYFDNTYRAFASTGPEDQFADQMHTWDLDVQHRFNADARNNILYGFDYRFISDRTEDSTELFFTPPNKDLQLFSPYIQDEITLIPKTLKLTLGTKFEYTTYSNWDIQPTGRIAWTPTERQTYWAAISRAVRTPSRLEEDSTTGVVGPNPDFQPEKVLAYELGYRVRPIDQLALSVSPFFNHYDDLRSLNFVSPTALDFQNSNQADSWGVEFSAEAQLAPWWRLRGGYTYVDKNIYTHDPTVLPAGDVVEADDPYNQAMFQSMMDLPEHLQFDLIGRYVDRLPFPDVRSYFSLDARLAWHYRNLEFSIVGQNLLDNLHSEFSTNEIPRGYYGRFSLWW